MSKTQIIILTFTRDGYYQCDGLPRPIKIGGGLEQGNLGCGACPRFSYCAMSHVATLATTVSDLAAVEALCKTKGWKFKRDQKTYAWWGHHVGDYPVPAGMKVSDLGKCSHAIGVPGTTWEIGLVKVEEGYRLAYDFYGSKGAPLQKAIGPDGGLFLQGYGLELAKMTAENLGYFGMEQTTLDNGDVQLEVQVGG